jgi:hypothetical protein
VIFGIVRSVTDKLVNFPNSFIASTYLDKEGNRLVASRLQYGSSYKGLMILIPDLFSYGFGNRLVLYTR